MENAMRNSMFAVHYFLIDPHIKRIQINLIRNGIIISFIAALLAGCQSSAEKPADAVQALALPVMQVTARTETTFTEYPASVQGAVDIDVRPQIRGYIQSVLVNEGAFVSAGQTLFIINAQPYTEALNNAKASLQAAEAAIFNAQLEVDKLIPLFENRVISEFQLKAARTARQIAQATAAQAKANVETAKINLSYTRITASVSGYIGRISMKQGSLVSPDDASALTQLSDIHEVHVYFALAENDFNVFNMNYAGKTPAERIKNLPPVELILSDGSAYPLKGKIDMIDGRFDKNTGAITLRASFPNPKGNLRSGNTGKLRLGLKHDNAILLPQSATLEMQDKVFVFAVNNEKKVNKIPISIIGKSGTNYLIKEGLTPGDQIVLSGLDRLQEGQMIRPQKTTDMAAQLNNEK